MMVDLLVEGGKGEYDSHNLLSTWADMLKTVYLLMVIDGVFTLLPWYYGLTSLLTVGVKHLQG